MKRRMISILLLASTLLASCGGTGSGTESTADAPGETSGTTDTETEKLTSGLEAVDYGGEEVNFLTYKNSDYQNSQMDILAETLNGEHVNDAVYNRNKTLEEKYNVVIKSDGDSSFDALAAAVNKLVMAGDDTYDICLLSAVNALKCGFAGSLLPMGEVPHIDLSKPWWNDRIAGDTSILGVNYFYIGDMNLNTWTQSYVTYFNKRLAVDYDIPDLYETVKAGKWTFDELTRLTKTVYRDLNGNGEYDENDLYGLSACSVCIDCFWISSGVRFISKDADDGLVLSIDEKVYDMWQRMADLLDAPEMLYTDRPQYTKMRDTYDRGAFVEDRALFFIEGLCVASNKLRDMETDYGIIPVPKNDESQENYSVYSHATHNSTVSVPTTSSGKLDMLGRIIEDMAYFSSETVRPAYYDMMLAGKLARAEEDVEMLGIITNSISYDLAYSLLDMWSLRSAVTSKPAASYIESQRSTYEKAINQAMDSVRENTAS